MRGFEPRSRHHDSGACSPLHHTGKNNCCHTPETVPYSGSLNQSQHNAVFVVAPQREVATYSTSGRHLTFLPKHRTSGARWNRLLTKTRFSYFYNPWSGWLVPRACTSSTRVGWDPGTSASPCVLVGLISHFFRWRNTV
jgi:hypothetical protein